MRNKFKFMIILFIFFQACEPINELQNNKFNRSLLFNLIANADKQNIYYYEIIKKELSFFSSGSDSFFVQNANIVVNCSDSTFDKFSVEKSSSFGSDHNLHYSNQQTFIIKPETEYELKIIENGNLITGKTKTPSYFNIIYPKLNSTLNKSDYENIELKWEKSRLAFGYLIKPITAKYRVETYITQDTVFNFSLNNIEKGKLKFEVYAYDENFYDHFVNKNQSSGLKGAYGYLGSSVLKSVTVNIEK